MNTAGRPLHRVLLDGEGAADPLRAIAMAPGEPAFYWRSDARDVEIAGLGAVRSIEACGAGRFDEAAAALAALRADTRDSDTELAALPMAVGGFAFDHERPPSPWDGFPALRFFVPRVMWVRSGGRRRIVLARGGARCRTPYPLLAARPAGPDAGTEDAGAWRRRVESAVAAIRGGDLEKIVLARRHVARLATGVAAADLVGELAASRPSCFTFLLRWSGRSFVGSSPERLLRVRSGDVDADALAGTAPRGLSPAHDESLARELEGSTKDRREHDIVVAAIRDALAPVSAGVDVAPQPTVLRLPEAHHLHTPVRARLAAHSPSALFDVAGRLHPTPAVCGTPRERAFEQLVREEADRGWYGGAVGWAAGNGDGELAVALRAALVDGRLAHVWAGAGVVEGSSPEREYEETDRKMQSILPLLERGDDECAA